MGANVKQIKHFINGKYVEGKSGRFEDVYNPSKAEVHAKAPLASKEEVQTAIACAANAFPKWAETPPAKRAEVMFRFRSLIIERMDELVDVVSLEHGKTREDAKGSITRGLEVVDFCCGITSHLKSDFSANVSREIDCYNLRQPLGVCAGITPFNFPAMVPMWMFPLAIATGNTFVLKPSEKVPSTSLRLAELLKEAGLPDGVLNVVVGDKEAVDEILENPAVKAISFVGSTPVGEYIYKKGCSHGKRVQALCGAKNHMVIMPDADIDKAVDALMGSVYGSAGERCMAISVAVMVGDEVADRVLEKLTPRVKSLKVGAFDEKDTEMGPIITKQSLDRICSYLDKGKEEGAKLVLDGRENAPKKTGFFIGGSIFDHVGKNMSIYTDEIFGPVLSIVRAKNYEEALALVNEHEYGNGVAIFTRDGDTARHFSHHCTIGMVGINVPIPVPVAYHSFGGWKRSIFGGYSIHGMEGVRFYTQLKTITSRWPSGMREGAQFNFTGGSD